MTLVLSRILLAASGLFLAAAPVLRALPPNGSFDGLHALLSGSVQLIRAGAWLDMALGALLLALSVLPRRALLGAGRGVSAFVGRSNLGDRLLLESAAAADAGHGRAWLRDALFLAVVTAAAALAYLPSLGLYADDYAFLAAFAFSADQSLPGLFGTLYAEGQERMRPLHFLYLSALHDAFGFRLIWYQVANLGVIAGCAIAFYLALRALGQPRALVLAVPLIYASLPHFSTDRMWISAFQIPLSVLLYFLSLNADLRGLRAGGAGFWAWKAVGAMALVASILAYEITLFLVLLNPLIVWIRSRQLPGLAPPDRRLKTAAGLAITFLLVAAVLVFKWTVSLRIDMNNGFFDHLSKQFYMLISPFYAIDYGAGLNFWRVIYIDFIHYGLLLPFRAFQAARDHAEPREVALALAIAVIVFGYLRAAAVADEAWPASRRDWLRVCLAGLVIHGLGYATFLLTPQILLTPTGVGNRVSMAAAAGVAICLFGVVGWLAAHARSRGARATLLSGLTAFVVAAGFLVNGAIASFWAVAHERQARVLEAIEQEFPTLPRGTTFILHGICPYVGPGIVFETSFDLGSALQLLYGDPTIRGDVIAGNAEVGESGIRVRFYGTWHEHPYGENVIIFDAARGTGSRLTDEQAARRYFAGSDDDRPGPDCPAGREGLGLPIF